MTNNANLQAVQYKTLHRTHYTREKMFKMGFTSEIYMSLGTALQLNFFWKEVTQTLSRFLDCLITLSPSLYLLGDLSELSLDATKNNKLRLIALTIAKKTIFMSWKSRNNIHLSL